VPDSDVFARHSITLVQENVCHWLAKWQYRTMKGNGGLHNMGRILLGIVLGIVLAPLALLGWFRFGRPPVAVADSPLPMEASITQGPLHARINREMAKKTPVEVDEEDLLVGARIYRDQCAFCHGFHGKPSAFGAHMFPPAPPLWEKHGKGDVVGVSDDPVGETYWKVANGIRLTGMPAYKQTLTEIQMWQVSQLLANANKPLPPTALDIVSGLPEMPAAPATGAAAKDHK
jgi:mono/diheme cytochrome c family protein